jgi:hypothetical protein
MIGVLAKPSDVPVVREFFELFKTSWEFYSPGGRYDVLVCSGEEDFRQDTAKLIVIYSSCETAFETEVQMQIVPSPKPLAYKRQRVPIYGKSVGFASICTDGSLSQEEHGPVFTRRASNSTIVRIGYDLFSEVRTLLTMGQPACYAAVPTLDLHIALLRETILASGIQLLEIPPVPEGYRFIACLTHDVDHPSVRLHKFDHTMFGFLYRALAGSLLALVRGRMSCGDVVNNWSAAIKLPLVHLNLAKDFWLEADYYRKLDGGLPSTYFFIPFANNPGRTEYGLAPRRRKSKYGAADVSAQIAVLNFRGHEVGLHGIDAWIDSKAGCKELEEVRRLTQQPNIGSRMHWLYFNEQSPAELERAGIDYDSTAGYCETIGYKSGTTQVYKPLNAQTLLELPLHVMDTALFFPCHMNLSPRDAGKRLSTMVRYAADHGGCLTINWHDRSAAPERLWGRTYVELVAELKAKGAWFATAAQATAWFRKRRAASVERVDSNSFVPGERTAVVADDLPALQLRVLSEEPQQQLEPSLSYVN